MTDQKGLGQRSDAELESLFGNMYAGWARGVNVTQERFGDGETRFTETAMTPLELAARYVAAEIGSNIYEIANRAAFAPITVFSQIQARIGPVFEEAATALEAKDKEIEALQRALFFWMPGVDARLDEPTRELASEDALLLAGYDGTVDGPCWGDAVLARAETAERELTNLLAIIHRDDGHYTEDHGLENSVKDAHLVWAKLQRERDEARAALKPFAAVAEHDIAGGETDDDYFQPMTKYNHAPRLRVGHLRAARAITGE